MMGKKWTTEEQDEFLDGYHTQYLESQKEGRYGKLWPLVDEAWFSKYPEIKTAFPDKSADDLTEMEKDSLKDAIRKRQQVSSDPMISLALYNFIIIAT